MKRLVDAVWINEWECIQGVSAGIIREVFDGDVLVDDDLIEFFPEHSNWFRLRYRPVHDVRCLVFKDGPGVGADKSGP